MSLCSRLQPTLRFAAQRNFSTGKLSPPLRFLPTAKRCSTQVEQQQSRRLPSSRPPRLPRPPRPVRLSPSRRAAARRAKSDLRQRPSPDIVGTVNDPVVFPAPNKAHGSYHWTFERFLSAALVPLVAATAVTSVNPVLDGVLSVALVAHSHMVRAGDITAGERGDKADGWDSVAQGFDQILIDYLHPRKFPVLGNVAKWFVRLATGGVLVGVYQFNTNDVGAFRFKGMRMGET